MSSELQHVDEADLVMFEIRDVEGRPTGQGGLAPNQAMHEHVRYVDGFSFMATTAYAQVTIDETVARAVGKPHLAGRQTPMVPTAVVILDFPDYPDPNGVSLVVPIVDLERMISALQGVLKDGRHVEDFARRAITRAMAPLAEKAIEERAAVATRCVVPGCARQRHVFDGDQGYCKRHARKKGLL